MLSSQARQRLSPALLEQLRTLTTSTVSQQAVPATTQDTSSEGTGLLAKVLSFGGFGPSRSAVPLTDPLPIFQEAPHITPPSTQPKTESTTLSNGVKIVSEATYVSPSQSEVADYSIGPDIMCLVSCKA